MSEGVDERAGSRGLPLALALALASFPRPPFALSSSSVRYVASLKDDTTKQAKEDATRANEITAHKEELRSLKDTQREFFEFLENEAKDLLNFEDESELEDLSDSEQEGPGEAVESEEGEDGKVDEDDEEPESDDMETEGNEEEEESEGHVKQRATVRVYLRKVGLKMV